MGTGRIGVLADIHANLPALDAAVAAVERHDVDRWLCAGDVVGYGAQPAACIERVRELGARCVAGNHDLMVLGELSDEDVPRLARDAVRWTRSALSPADAAWLRALPRRASWGTVALAHGGLDDPERYVLSAADAVGELRRLGEGGEELLVLGHTHLPLAVAERSGALRTADRTVLPPGERAVLNPGAVGQSRERRDILARALVLDPAMREARFVAVPYDVERALAALRARGLDERAIHLPPAPVWRRAGRRVRRSARRRAARAARSVLRR